MEYRYLGVKLDSLLKLDTHLRATEQSARQKIFKLAKLKNQMLRLEEVHKINELLADGICFYHSPILPNIDFYLLPLFSTVSTYVHTVYTRSTINSHKYKNTRFSTYVGLQSTKTRVMFRYGL